MYYNYVYFSDILYQKYQYSYWLVIDKVSVGRIKTS